jgi:hypothetical protein
MHLRTLPCGFRTLPINAAFEPTLRRVACLVSRGLLGSSTTANLAGCSRLLPLCDCFQTTPIVLRTLDALVPKARERHLFYHRWDRLLLLRKRFNGALE